MVSSGYYFYNLHSSAADALYHSECIIYQTRQLRKEPVNQPQNNIMTNLFYTGFDCLDQHKVHDKSIWQYWKDGHYVMPL